MDRYEQAQEKIIVAIDEWNIHRVLRMVEQLSPFVKRFKIGLSALMGVGAPEAIGLVHAFGRNIFIDGKFSDTPNTLDNTMQALRQWPYIEFFTVHASAGETALFETAREKGNMKMLAVTVPTSFTNEDTERTFRMDRIEAVEHFAHIAIDAGADGIVCAAHDLSWLLQGKRKDEIKRVIKVVPGIRPLWYGAKDDQRNIGTPKDAVRKGANFLVIGRPITHPPKEIGSSENAMERIVKEIAEVL